MSEMEVRLTKVAVTPTASVIQERQNIAVELLCISALVEEMLTMVKKTFI
jgi:hypothetical protein